ncbi:MAG: DUF2281 domain-containing protein [Candidatus Latescibacterota bacterium]
MASTQLLEIIEGKLRKLPDDRLREIAHFADFLLARRSIAPRAHRFSDLCGTLSDGDAGAMRSAIEDACERVNSDEW